MYSVATGVVCKRERESEKDRGQSDNWLYLDTSNSDVSLTTCDPCLLIGAIWWVPRKPDRKCSNHNNVHHNAILVCGVEVT